MYMNINQYQGEWCPPNGIFSPCARLLAGRCGAWRLLASRRRRRCRHSVPVPLWDPKIDEQLQNQYTCSKISGACFLS